MRKMTEVMVLAAGVFMGASLWVAAELDTAPGETIEQPRPAVATPRIRPAAVADLSLEELERQEEVRRQAREEEGLRKLQEASQAYDRGRYREAQRLYQAAIDAIPDRPGTEGYLRQARTGKVDSLYQLAQRIHRDPDGDLDEARRLLDQALESAPGERRLLRMVSRIDRVERRREDIAARPVPLEYRPDRVEQRDQIAAWLAEGRQAYEAGAYDKAETLFERVLQEDRYNTDASRFLTKVAERRWEVSSARREATVAAAMSRIREAWNPPVVREVDLPVDPTAPDPTHITETERTRRRMEQLIIPSIDFRRANIYDVFEFLREASVDVDPDGLGVNLILNLEAQPGAPRATTPARPAPRPRADDAWDDDWGFDSPATTPRAAAEPAAPAAADRISTITLSLRRVSLLKAMEIITEVAGLRYRIDGSVVMVTPTDFPTGPIVNRTYRVQPTLVETIIEDADDTRDRGRTGEFVEMRRERATVRRADVREYFINMGVPFPAGTSITYNPGTSQLIVANYAENLDILERLLAELDVVPNQIEIEARFVELAHDKINELGLQWLLTDTYQIAQRRDSPAPLGGTQRIQAEAGPLTKGLRFFNLGEAGVEPAHVTGAGAGLGSMLSISSILTNPELQVVLHALDRSGATDLLSAPRVTTRSGQTATIQVVREIIYPTDFETTEPTFSDAGTVITPPVVTPHNFETRETGVILTVTPEVGADRYTINLTMQPEVSELSEWLQYGSTLQGFTYNIPQPVFDSRRVTTSIVIWDGQTVVMGGMMREQLVKFKDKIPLLGDIPFLGRLFRSEGEYSQKRNLVIFVTARLVKPDGTPLNRMEEVIMPGDTPPAAAAPAAAPRG